MPSPMNALIDGHQLARELFEHEVLILHLGDEARRLEQALAVVPARGRVGRFPRRHFGRGQTECRGVNQGVDVGLQAVVLRVEHRVHRGQRDVLVAAAVAGDEVDAEQLVVVACRSPAAASRCR